MLFVLHEAEGEGGSVLLTEMTLPVHHVSLHVLHLLHVVSLLYSYIHSYVYM